MCEQISLDEFQIAITNCQNNQQLMNLLRTKYNLSPDFFIQILKKAITSLKPAALNHVLRLNSLLPVDSLLRADDAQILVLLQKSVTLGKMDAFLVLIPHIKNSEQYPTRIELQSLAILAAQFGNIEAARLLCLNFAVCLQQTIQGRSFFIEVIRSTSPESKTPLKSIIADFLDMGVNMNIQEPDGTTPLHVAVEKDDVDAVKLLLSSGACSSMKNAQGKTPLDVSKSKEMTTILKELAEDSIPPSEASLYSAAEQSDFVSVQKLLGKGIPVDTKWIHGKTALAAAAQVGDAKMVEYLLSEGASPIPLGCYWPDLPARIAMLNGHADIALMLMKSTEEYISKANEMEVKHIRTQLVSLLHHCCRVGAIRVAKMVLKSRAKINPNHEYRRHLAPIHVAAKYGQLRMVKLLINYRAKADQPTEIYCNMPLHYACFYGHINVAKFLLALQTVSVNCKNIQHETPLYCVLRCQLTPDEKNSFVREDSVIFLLSKSALLIKPGRRKCELKEFSLEVANQRWNFLPLQTQKLLMVLRDEGRHMSLASECRLTIRGSMQVPVNEETVGELGLPYRLQHYILLKDWFSA